MHLLTHLLKATILLYGIPLLFIAVQSAHAQGEEEQLDVPEFSNCSSILANDCQINLISSSALETAADRWEIKLDDESFLPTSVQTKEFPGSIAIVVDGSDVMRSGQPSPLRQVAISVNKLSEKLIATNPQITEALLNQLFWTIFFIGAENADDLYTGCDIEEFGSDCPDDDIWVHDSNRLGNASIGFEKTYKPDETLGATPFIIPLTKVIDSFENRTGPKHIVCFCEGLDTTEGSKLETTISLANEDDIRIHVIHMWKGILLSGEIADASDSLKILAEKTGGEFVPIDGNITTVWKAITEELTDYQYTVTLPEVEKPAEKIQIAYKDDAGNWIPQVDTDFPEITEAPKPENTIAPEPEAPVAPVVSEPEVTETTANIYIYENLIELPHNNQPQEISIPPSATGIDIQIESDDGHISVDTIKIDDKLWTQDEFQNAAISDLFLTTDGPITRQGELTLIDSASAAPILVPLTLVIAQPESPSILEFETEAAGHVIVPQPEDSSQAIIPVPAPKGIGDKLVPTSLKCGFLGGDLVEMPNPADMQCEIPFNEILAEGSQLSVSLTDQFGFEYSGQVPLRIDNPFIPEVTPVPPDPLAIIIRTLGRLPRWLWWPMGIGIPLMAVAAAVFFASRLKYRPVEPHFEPDDEATERSGAGIFFPPTPLAGGMDVTERLSYVLPVAKLTLEHAPAGDRSSLSPDITIYPNTLKWGIGREMSKLLVEPEYSDAEPIEIKAKSVSRVQARLEFDMDIEGFFLVGDMAANGTYINRTKLDPLEPYPLQAGDEVQFGKIAYKFELLEMDLQKAFIEFSNPQDADRFVTEEVAGTDLDPTVR